MLIWIGFSALCVADLSKSRTELAEANDLKKQLIRYVFHEVPVSLQLLFGITRNFEFKQLLTVGFAMLVARPSRCCSVER